MALRIKDSFDTLNLSSELDNLFYSPSYKQLIFSCVHQDPAQRPSFSQILEFIDSMLNVEYNLELIAQNNWMDKLKEGLEKGKISVNSKDKLHRTLVHQCCIFGNLEMLKFLCELWGKEILRSVDIHKVNLFHLAARSGYLEILQYLVNQIGPFICIDKEDRFQLTSLDLAIALNHGKCVDFLLSFANQQVLDSALLNASQEGNLELAKKLVQCGADLEARMFDTGSTPLDRACYNGHLKVVEYLFSEGAKVNQTRFNGSTPLFQASQNGHLEVVKFLLRNGGNPNLIRTVDGSFPLLMATFEGYIDIVQELIRFGAHVNQKRGLDGSSAIYVACEFGHKEVLQLLIKNGAEVNSIRIKDGHSPLFIAAQKSFKQISEILLENGADPNYIAPNSTSALTIACHFGSIDVVPLLLQYGANPNHKWAGQTVINYVKVRNPAIYKIFLEFVKEIPT